MIEVLTAETIRIREMVWQGRTLGWAIVGPTGDPIADGETGDKYGYAQYPTHDEATEALPRLRAALARNEI